MATKVYDKRGLIELFGTLKEDDIILVSGDLDGNIQVFPKKNNKRVPFSFAADAFSRPGDVGHIAFGKTPAIAFIVCRPDEVSEGAKSLLPKRKNTPKLKP